MTKKQTKNGQTEEQIAEETALEDAVTEAMAEEIVDTGSAQLSLEEQVKDLEDRNLRLLAEMQNIRNRHQKDLKDTREYAVTGFANDMISISENLYRAREAIPHADDELYKKLVAGIDLTIEELKKTFTRHGIERIAPEAGDKFNYELHQAIAQVPTDEFDEGEIVSLVSAGYKLKDRILKPAMVAVAKKLGE